jgi:hypothetical protein
LRVRVIRGLAQEKARELITSLRKGGNGHERKQYICAKRKRKVRMVSRVSLMPVRSPEFFIDSHG